MTPHFGSKVTGHEAFDAAVRNEQGGGNVFGSRVRGSITEDGPTNAAKRNTEFGINIVDKATGSDEKGKPGDTVSIDSLRNILAENPTFFDSLYEAELAREDGARPDALAIFYEVERGIKGQMRPDVMAEIRTLMGGKGVDTDAIADEGKVRAEMLRRQVERQNANQAGLGLNERDAAANALSANTEHQRRGIADELGLTLADQTGSTETATGNVPTKPDGDIHPETQTSGNRLGVPKGDSGTTGEGSSASGSSPATGAASEGGESGESTKTDETGTGNEVVPDDFTKGELEDSLSKALGEEKFGKIKGTGSEGAVLKADLVKAATKGLKDGSLKIENGQIVAAS